MNLILGLTDFESILTSVPRTKKMYFTFFVIVLQGQGSFFSILRNVSGLIASI